jgi:hypothetical protein
MKMVKWYVATCVIAGLLVAGCNQPTEKSKTDAKPAAVAAKPAETPKAAAKPAEPAKTAEPAKAAEPAKTPAPAPAPAPKPAEAPKPAPTTGAKFVVRVNCGGAEYKDKAGNTWAADQDFTAGKWGAVDGSTSDRTGQGVKGTDNPTIYETERYSMESYKFTVPAGTYTVTLHFAETYDGIGAAGDRVFDVSINGKAVLTGFDPFKEGNGANKAVVKTFKDIQPANGLITIGFTPKVENPEINGIEIVAQ